VTVVAVIKLLPRISLLVMNMEETSYTDLFQLM